MEEEDAIRLFQRIQDEFPELEMDMDRGQAPDYVLLVMNIPQQPGLGFDVHLNLQNGDELHLCAGNFWYEWFPSATETVVNRYYDAVTGLLSGRYRILQLWKHNKPIGAKLQKPVGHDWETIRRFGLYFCFPWGQTTKILQNVPPQDSVDPK